MMWVCGLGLDFRKLSSKDHAATINYLGKTSFYFVRLTEFLVDTDLENVNNTISHSLYSNY